jgi:hypothetical protein
VVDCGAVVVVVVELFEEELLEPEVAPVVGLLVVVVFVEADFVELCVDPGRTTARATAPATPDTPTAEVTAFMRARSRRRLRCGWSGMGHSVR